MPTPSDIGLRHSLRVSQPGISSSAWRRVASKRQQTFGSPNDLHFGCSGRQFRITFRDEAPAEFSLMIRNRLPSGAMSQLIGPVRIPVSTISVSKRARGVPDWKVGLVL